MNDQVPGPGLPHEVSETDATMPISRVVLPLRAGRWTPVPSIPAHVMPPTRRRAMPPPIPAAGQRATSAAVTPNDGPRIEQRGDRIDTAAFTTLVCRGELDDGPDTGLVDRESPPWYAPIARRTILALGAVAIATGILVALVLTGRTPG